jgi:hypothetical protein
MPQCVLATGVHKRAYPSRSSARKAARAAQAEYGRMDAYRCGECRSYHVGHNRQRESRAGE